MSYASLQLSLSTENDLFLIKSLAPRYAAYIVDLQSDLLGTPYTVKVLFETMEDVIEFLTELQELKFETV